MPVRTIIYNINSLNFEIGEKYDVVDIQLVSKNVLERDGDYLSLNKGGKTTSTISDKTLIMGKGRFDRLYPTNTRASHPEKSTK